MYPRPPINVVTVFGLSIFGRDGVLLAVCCCDVTLALLEFVDAEEDTVDEAIDVIDGGPEFEFVVEVTEIVAADVD